MKIKDEKSGIKEQGKNNISKKSTKRINTDKKQTSDPETNVSVFTKTTNPKVIIKTEKIENNGNGVYKSHNKREILKFLCLIIIGIIILTTFFLSLQTYNTVNKLADYILL